MKKLISIVMALCLMLCLASCEGDPISGTTGDAHLTEYAARSGTDLDYIMCSQLILVCADGAQARVDCYERGADGSFEAVAGLSDMPGFVSAQGLTDSKQDNDIRTPTGLHILGHALGCMPNPDTELEYVELDADSCWITDPDSPDYNTFVQDGELSANGLRFASEPEKYAYGVLVSYNTDPVVRGRGTAFFFHCGSEPTDGGIALETDDMRALVAWLRPDGLACTLICEV